MSKLNTEGMHGADNGPLSLTSLTGTHAGKSTELEYKTLLVWPKWLSMQPSEEHTLPFVEETNFRCQVSKSKDLRHMMASGKRYKKKHLLCMSLLLGNQISYRHSLTARCLH